MSVFSSCRACSSYKVALFQDILELLTDTENYKELTQSNEDDTIMKKLTKKYEHEHEHEVRTRTNQTFMCY